jgi:hypothetical protein
MTDVQKDEAQQLKTQLQQCLGFDGDEISQAREDALKYYFQRQRGDEVTGRSAVVSGDVSAMVEATLAQMVDAFTSDRICDFDPIDADDEDQAQLESEAVQWFVMGRENGFLELVSAIKEALLMRNGVIRIEAEDRKTRRVKRFGNVLPEAYAELREQPGVVADKYDADTKELMLTFERSTRDFVMQSVPLENFLYHSEWHRPTLNGIPLYAERHVTPRADLVALGFPEAKVKDLTAHRHDLKAESQARNPRHGAKMASKALDTSQDLIEWYEVHARREAAGGVDELRRICISYQDSVILKDEPAPFIKHASGTAILNPHRFTGISLYDKLKQNQDIRTALRRALLDNVNATTKNRLAGLDGVVNTDDTSDGRVNNLVRVKNIVPDVRQAVMALAVPDTSANILANLESTARERSEMGGAALDLQTAQMQIGGDRMGSQGLEKAYSVAEQLSASMMKTLASTLIRETFLLAHRTLREYFDEPVAIKRNGKWTYVTPAEWPERHSVTIKPGMSPGERARRINSMTQIIDAQMMLADRGMDEVLVNLDSFNRALLDWARLAEVQNPEQYFLDPQSDQSRAALQSKQKAAEQQKQQKAMLMQQAFGLEQLRTGFEKYRHDSELVFKYFAELLGVEVEEARIAGQAAADIIKQQRVPNEQGKAKGNGQAAPGQSAAGGDSSES